MKPKSPTPSDNVPDLPGPVDPDLPDLPIPEEAPGLPDRPDEAPPPIRLSRGGAGNGG